LSRNRISEIIYHYWDIQERNWPTAKRPDLIFFDPPYYTKKKKEYKENTDNSITIFDYQRMLLKTGCKVTHRIECPLSSERMSGEEVRKMQESRILGTVGRSLIIARRW